MFERINASIAKDSDKVKSITIKIKVSSNKGPWKVADIQLQEGSVATEYVEHVSELERTGG